jgi:hypothetical protein
MCLTASSAPVGLERVKGVKLLMPHWSCLALENQEGVMIDQLMMPSAFRIVCGFGWIFTEMTG